MQCFTSRGPRHRPEADVQPRPPIPNQVLPLQPAQAVAPRHQSRSPGPGTGTGRCQCRPDGADRV